MILSRTFDKFSQRVTNIVGSHWAFFVACAVIIVWALTGFIFGFSDSWQLVINTGTTIITFLMVFIIQQSSNKRDTAQQLKLDELLRALEQARNEFRGIENRTEDEIKKLKDENY